MIPRQCHHDVQSEVVEELGGLNGRDGGKQTSDALVFFSFPLLHHLIRTCLATAWQTATRTPAPART